MTTVELLDAAREPLRESGGTVVLVGVTGAGVARGRRRTAAYAAAKSALLTRGIVEMARFGKARGADVRTFFGLAGFGDLVTTCCSKHSRNRAVGEAIGRGKSLQEVLDEMKMVAEGVWTTRALFGPEAAHDPVSMPIAEQVNAVLFEGKDPRTAVDDLMGREPTGEMDGLFEGVGR